MNREVRLPKAVAGDGNSKEGLIKGNLVPFMQEVLRCDWAKTPGMIKYHDEEWGIPVHDDLKLFELLILESAQAGLSWETILRKRENYRIAFDNFNPEKISKYDEKKIRELLGNEGIIRNKLKILSAINNSKKFLEVKNAFGTFDKYIWGFTNNKQIINNFKNISTIPATSDVSDKISRDLKNRGFTFIGSTICYAFLQAVGIVDDHVEGCWRRGKVKNK